MRPPLVDRERTLVPVARRALAVLARRPSRRRARRLRRRRLRRRRVGRGRRSRAAGRCKGSTGRSTRTDAMPFREFPPDVPDAQPDGLLPHARSRCPTSGAIGASCCTSAAPRARCSVWVNGTEVGIEQGLAPRSRVRRHRTRAVRRERTCSPPQVVRWSDASFVEDQDQWWHAGIHREVFLYSTPRTFLADVHATASLDARSRRPARSTCRSTSTSTKRERADGWIVAARVRDRARDARSPPPSSAAPCRATPRDVPVRRPHRALAHARSPTSRRGRPRHPTGTSCRSRCSIPTATCTTPRRLDRVPPDRDPAVATFLRQRRSRCCSAASTGTTSILTPVGS